MTKGYINKKIRLRKRRPLLTYPWASKAKSTKGDVAKAASFSAFLNPERVERQGGQNQLCERSTEKGLSKEEPEEEIEGKIPHGFSETWAMFAGPSGQARIQPKRPQYPYPYTLELERGEFRRSPRKNKALRKKWSEGYIAKENR